MSYIYIVPIELSDYSYLEPLKDALYSSFHLHTEISELQIDLSSTFDSYRNQYNSSLILLQLIATPPQDAARILGITEVDLFIPILTFVFGEAQLNGLGAVVSLNRLNNQFYGLPEDEALLKDRLVKEAVHELGHTFGLIHCARPQCVMNSSTYAEDVDQKSAELCSYCQSEMKLG
ncbi:MAG: archaemetzincin [Thermodesulfobacteriota bacterium]|nr:archaemetzincin [Thermodesulfobacteriota bacterium]